MMKSVFDKNISNEFRNTINGNHSFVRNNFTDFVGDNNEEKKNLWSKICSCMDWIDVSISGLQDFPMFDKEFQLKRSLEFTQFILTIDMLTEAIKNLWTTFYLGGIKNSSLVTKNEIFKGTVWGESVSDDVYFKHVRAFFGMHSVNGNEVSLYIDGKKVKARFFSSWSFGRDEKEFEVFLYSNNKEAEKIYGGSLKVEVQELVDYASERYYTLIELSNEIDKLYIKKRKEKIKNNKIILDENSTPLQKLRYLRNSARNDNLLKEYHSEEIEWYIKMLEVEDNVFDKEGKEIIKKYREYIEKNVINCYHNALSNMNLDYQEDIAMIRVNSNEFGYEYTKVLNFCEYSSDDFEYNIFEELKMLKENCLNILIEEKELPKYSAKLKQEELYLLIHAEAYRKVSKTNLLK